MESDHIDMQDLEKKSLVKVRHTELSIRPIHVNYVVMALNNWNLQKLKLKIVYVN